MPEAQAARMPRVVYTTALGAQHVGDSLDLLAALQPASVDLIITSPPFALLRTKSYGNSPQTEYVAWLARFGEAAKRVLKESGSFVVELGGAYQQGRPSRSIYKLPRADRRAIVKSCG